MSEVTEQKDESILRIETIGTRRDALRAAVAALSARETYEETMEKMGPARPASAVEDASRQLTLSQARKSWEGSLKALETARDDFRVASQICPLPTSAESQIEGHVMREAAVARRSLEKALEGREDISPEQPLEEIVEALLAQQPIAEPEMDKASFVGRTRPVVGGRAVLGGF